MSYCSVSFIVSLWCEFFMITFSGYARELTIKEADWVSAIDCKIHLHVESPPEDRKYLIICFCGVLKYHGFRCSAEFVVF